MKTFKVVVVMLFALIPDFICGTIGLASILLCLFLFYLDPTTVLLFSLFLAFGMFVLLVAVLPWLHELMQARDGIHARMLARIQRWAIG